MATFNQRELGTDFDSFSNGLRAALRQAPKVILVGEMRDRETVKIALSAAETGHLVLSTLHTIDAGQTINRILGMFETEEQEQIRARLADTLRWVVSQRLVPKVEGGRYAFSKSWVPTSAPRKPFASAKAKAKAFTKSSKPASPSAGAPSTSPPWKPTRTGKITEETALLYCTKRGPVTRGIDNIKKARGESTTSHGLAAHESHPGTPNRAATPRPRHAQTQIIYGRQDLISSAQPTSPLCWRSPPPNGSKPPGPP